MSGTNSAILSDCGTYRYELRRHVPCALRWIEPALFILFNPSTADAAKDDATVRKGRGFCQRWYCTEMIFWNLYAFRSRDPKALKKAEDPVGPLNDEHLRKILKSHVSGNVVLAWGTLVGPAMSRRVFQVSRILREHGKQPWAIKLNDNGSPAHPLMLGYDNELKPVDLDRLEKVYQ